MNVDMLTFVNGIHNICMIEDALWQTRTDIIHCDNRLGRSFQFHFIYTKYAFKCLMF